MANFLRYVEDAFYDGTLFHRVIRGFMIQGGGIEPGMRHKAARAPIRNEADNGLRNIAGTIAMARTQDPHSATAQFFINTVDNAFLDFKSKTPEGLGLLRVRTGGRGHGGRCPHRKHPHRRAFGLSRRAGAGDPGRAGRSAGTLIRAAREGRAAAMTTLFVSDLHLHRERPEMVERFVAFLDFEARAAERLYVLGDLFDLWLGDDDGREPHPRVLAALRRLSDAGVRSHVARGNHDFLLGRRFERESGCRLLPEPARIDLHGTPVVVLHGDVPLHPGRGLPGLPAHRPRPPDGRRTFFACRSRPSRARGEAAPIAPGRPPGSRARTSWTSPRRRSPACSRTPGTRCMIHGHTPPACGAPDRGGGAPATRIVLGDWYEQGSVLVWNEHGFRNETLDDRIAPLH